MKITLKQVIAYEVFSEDGVSMGNFERVSTWEGLEKLVSRTRGELIVMPEPGEYNKVFGQIFGGGHQVTVVSATPNLLVDLKTAPPEQSPSHPVGTIRVNQPTGQFLYVEPTDPAYAKYETRYHQEDEGEMLLENGNWVSIPF